MRFERALLSFWVSKRHRQSQGHTQYDFVVFVASVAWSSRHIKYWSCVLNSRWTFITNLWSKASNSESMIFIYVFPLSAGQSKMKIDRFVVRYAFINDNISSIIKQAPETLNHLIERNEKDNKPLDQIENKRFGSLENFPFSFIVHFWSFRDMNNFSLLHLLSERVASITVRLEWDQRHR